MGKGEAGLTNYTAAGNHSMGKGEASLTNYIEQENTASASCLIGGVTCYEEKPMPWLNIV